MKLRHMLALAIASLVLATTTAAHAAGPPYTVAIGGSTTGTQAMTFTSTGSVQIAWRTNAGTRIAFNCTSVSGNGAVAKGVGVNPVAAITSTTWIGCRAPGGPSTITQNGTWSLAGTGSNATPGTETIAGQLGNVSFGYSWTPSSICSFTVSGSLDTTFNEATQTLQVNETGFTGKATLSNVQECLGQAQNGNPFNLVADLNVSTDGAGAINLS